MTVSIHRNNITRLDAFKDAANKVKNNLGRNISHAGNIDDILKIRDSQTQYSQSLVHDFLSLLQSARSVKNPSVPHENAKGPEQNRLEAESAGSAKVNMQNVAGANADGEKNSSSILAQLSTALQECPSSVTYHGNLKQAAMADLVADLSAEKSLSKPACTQNEVKIFNRQLASGDKDEIAQKSLDDFLIMRHLIKKDGLDETQTRALNQVTEEFIKFIGKNGLGQFSAAAGAMGKHGDKGGKLKEFNKICNKLAAINDEKRNFTLNKDIAQEIHTVLAKHITSNSDLEAITKNVNNFLRESYREHTNIRQAIMGDDSTGLFDKKRTLFNHESLVLDLLKKSMDKIAGADDKKMHKPAAVEQIPKVNGGEAQPGVYAPVFYIDNSIHYHSGAQPATDNSGEKVSDQKDKLNHFADTQATTNVLPEREINKDQDLISGFDETDGVGDSYDEQSKVYGFADNTGDKSVLKHAEGGSSAEQQETFSEHFNNQTPVSDSVSLSVQPEGNPTQPLSVSEPPEAHQALQLQNVSDEIRQKGILQDEQQPEKAPDRHIISPLADSPQNIPKRNNVMTGNSVGTQTSGSQNVWERNNKSGQSVGEVQTDESTSPDKNQGLDRWGRRSYLQQQSESEKATGRSGYQRNRQVTPNVISANGVAGDISRRFVNSSAPATLRTSDSSASDEASVNLGQNVQQSAKLINSSSFAVQADNPQGKQDDANTVNSRFIDIPTAQVTRNPVIADDDKFAGQDRITPVRSSQQQNSASADQQLVQKRNNLLNSSTISEAQTDESATPQEKQSLDRWGRRSYLQQQSESEKASGRSAYQRNRQSTPNVQDAGSVAGDIARRFTHSLSPASLRASEPSANVQSAAYSGQDVRQRDGVASSSVPGRAASARSPQLQNSVSADQAPVQKRLLGELQTDESTSPQEYRGVDRWGRRSYLQQQSEREKASGRSGYQRNRQSTSDVANAGSTSGDIARRFINSRSLTPLKSSEPSTNGEAHTDSGLATRSWTGESAGLKTTSVMDRPGNRNDIHHPEQEMQRPEPQFYRRKISKAQVMQNPAIAEGDDFAGQGKTRPVQP